MTRYLKLYFTYIKRSIVTRLEYKKDTILSISMFFLSNVTAILSIYFVMQSIPSLQGWSMAELGFLYGFSMMPVALDHIFTDELWRVAYFRVVEGDMDRLFTKPVPVLFQVIAETFQPEGFGELIVGVVMLGVCSSLLSVTWTFASVVVLVVATVFGAVIITSFKIVIASFAFKIKRSGTILQVVYNFLRYTRYPVAIYPAFVRALLTFVFPFAVIISAPVETFLFAKYNAWLVCGVIVAVASSLFSLSLVVWKAFENRYQSTGS